MTIAPTDPNIRRILVPHDFSDTAESALSFALGLAKSLGASVIVMHAFDIPAYGFPEAPVMTADLAMQISQAAHLALDAVVERAKGPDRVVTGVLRQGTTWSEINGAAHDEKAD